MRKGKVAMTNSHQKELQAENLYVLKTRKRRDARLGGEGSQSQMDYSQVVDPTQVHEYPGRGEEVSQYYETEKVAHGEDVDGHVHATTPEPEPRQCLRAEVAPAVPIVGPPFPGGPETTLL
nr:hypothetical protein MtrDRAFT_AC149040g42v2 [Medicago truncatula]